jgi:hypothetical protein
MKKYKKTMDYDVDWLKLKEIANPINKKLPYIPLIPNKNAEISSKENIESGNKHNTSTQASSYLTDINTIKPTDTLGDPKKQPKQKKFRRKSPSSMHSKSDTSVFAQIIELLKTIDIQIIVRKFHCDKYMKSFDSWSHLVSLIFAHLAGTDSLKQIIIGLGVLGRDLYNLGFKKTPTRSNMSDANSRRDWQFFRDVFLELKARFTLAKEITPGHKFEFSDKRYSLDPKIIDISLEIFDWAKYKTRKGAVKLHAMLDNSSFLPTFSVITKTKNADIKNSKPTSFPKDAIIVADYEYKDFLLFQKLTDDDVYFISRKNESIQYDVVSKNTIPRAPGRPKKDEYVKEGTYVKPKVIKDETVLLSNPKSSLEYPGKLRVITAKIENPRTGESKETSIITNIFHLSASTVAAIFKDRYAIENFYTKINKNLKIKAFLGTSSNAIKSQLWVALTTMLLIEFLKYKSKLNWNISTLLFILRLNLGANESLYDILTDNNICDDSDTV